VILLLATFGLKMFIIRYLLRSSRTEQNDGVGNFGCIWISHEINVYPAKFPINSTVRPLGTGRRDATRRFWMASADKEHNLSMARRSFAELFATFNAKEFTLKNVA